MAGFNPQDPMHKKIALGALDHIDGQLGKFMHQTKASLGGTTPPPPLEGGSSGDGKADYVGKDQPGGHAGHSFGGKKDQHGANNAHAGPAAEENEGEGGSDLMSFAKKKGEGPDGGMGNMMSMLKR